MKKSTTKTKWGFLNSRNVVALLFVALFATTGIVLVLKSRALTPTSSFEPETTTLVAPATIVSDSNASSGKAIKFGALSTSGEKLVWSDEFNGTTLDTSKWTVVTGGENHSQAKYTANNVSVANGYLDLRTRRHCVTATSDALTDSNFSTVPCASGKLTVYSSGQVWTNNVLTTGRIEVRAKLPSTQLGLWPAIWLRNQTGWCNPNYGELDVMEWYGDYPNLDTATSHITCANESTVHRAHQYQNGSDVSTNWHTWGMTWNTSGITYTYDGNIVNATGGDADRTKDTVADFSGVSSATFTSIMSELWKIRLNTQVTKSGDAYHLPPDNAKNFQSVDYLIDYVRVYQ